MVANADAEVAGIVYVPAAEVQVNGSSSEFSMDQIIADTFKVNGSTGTIHVLKRVGVDAIITAAGFGRLRCARGNSGDSAFGGLAPARAGQRGG